MDALNDFSFCLNCSGTYVICSERFCPENAFVPGMASGRWRQSQHTHNRAGAVTAASQQNCMHLGGFVEDDGAGAGVVAGVAERSHDGGAAALQALAQHRTQRLAVPVPQVAPPVRHHLPQASLFWILISSAACCQLSYEHWQNP